MVMMSLQNDTFSPGLPDMLTATGNFVSASSDIQIYSIKRPGDQNQYLGVLRQKNKYIKIKCLNYDIYAVY